MDIRDISVKSDKMAQTIWIVKIEDETGFTVTSARVSCTTDTEAHAVAETWLNALCRINPGKLLRWVIQQAR